MQLIIRVKQGHGMAKFNEDLMYELLVDINTTYKNEFYQHGNHYDDKLVDKLKITYEEYQDLCKQAIVLQYLLPNTIDIAINLNSGFNSGETRPVSFRLGLKGRDFIQKYLQSSTDTKTQQQTESKQHHIQQPTQNNQSITFTPQITITNTNEVNQNINIEINNEWRELIKQIDTLDIDDDKKSDLKSKVCNIMKKVTTSLANAGVSVALGEAWNNL